MITLQPYETFQETLIEIGSWQKAQVEGKITLAGRDYLIKDKDVLEFKIGVK